MYLARRSGYNLELDKSVGYEIGIAGSSAMPLDVVAAAFVVQEARVVEGACFRLAYGLTGVDVVLVLVVEAWEEAEKELRFWRCGLRTAAAAAEEVGGVLA
jgi:hypothetical protein